MTALLVTYLAGGTLLSLLSIPLILGKIPPNGLYGVRVRATLQDPALWYSANRYAGQRLFATGIVFDLAALLLALFAGLSIDAYALACLGIFTLLFGVTIVQVIIFLKAAGREKG